MWHHLPAQPGAEGHEGDPPSISWPSGSRITLVSSPAGTGTGSGTGRAGSGECQPVGVLPSGVSRSKMHLLRKPDRVTSIPLSGLFASSPQQPGLPSRGISSVKRETSALQSLVCIPLRSPPKEKASRAREVSQNMADRQRAGCSQDAVCQHLLQHSRAGRSSRVLEVFASPCTWLY